MKGETCLERTVYVLATGGTISAAGVDGMTSGYSDGAFNIANLLGELRGLDPEITIQGEQILNISSDDITIKDWITLANRINLLAQDPAICGFVITHGTNTMEETSFFLNLTVKTEKPVVLTGSMRPATAMSADGTMNLYQAISLAATPEAAGRGVMVVFSDGIYSGRDVQKVNCFRTQAFGEKDLGCLGVMQDDRAYFLQKTAKPHTIQTEFDVTNINSLPRVDILFFAADMDADLLHYSMAHAQGIVLAGAGSGLCSKHWKAALQECADNQVPVVRGTRIANGFIGWDHIDHEYGTLPGYTLPPTKLRILLALALLNSNDREYLHNVLKKY